MQEPRTRYTFDRVVRMIISGAILVALLLLLRYLSNVLLPFAAAVVLAYLLNPIVTAIERRTRSRGVSVAVTIGGLVILGLAIIAVVVPLGYSQMVRLARDLDRLRADLTSATFGPDQIPVDIPATADRPEDKETDKTSLGWTELREGLAVYRATAGHMSRADRFTQLRLKISGTYVGDLIESGVQFMGTDEFKAWLARAAKYVAVGGWSVLTFTVNLILGLTGLILVGLYLVFLLLDYRTYAQQWQGFLPPQYREPVVEFLLEFDVVLRQVFRGQAVVACCYALLLAVGFTVISLPMGIPLGMFIGLLSMVPYLQTLGLIPAVLLALMRAVEADASVVTSLALALGVFLIVQAGVDWLITPRIMGKRTGLKPVAVLLGVFIWGKLLGFLGLVLAIPLTSLGIAYYRRYVLRDTTTRSEGGPDSNNNADGTVEGERSL